MITKERVYQIAILVLLIACIVSIALYRTTQAKLDSSKGVISLLDSTYAAQTKVWKDKYGKEHIQNTQLLLSVSDLQRFTAPTAAALKIAPKQITEQTQGEFYLAVDQSLHVDTVYVDSSKKIKSLEFDYKDKWVDIKGCLGECKDSIHIDGVDTLTQTTFWKRKWLLGDKTLYTDISNSNPYIHGAGIRSLALANKEPKILIAPVISIGYGTSNLVDHSYIPNVQIGIAIVPYAFSFKIR